MPCPRLPPRLGVLEVRRQARLSSQRHLTGWGRQMVPRGPQARPDLACGRSHHAPAAPARHTKPSPQRAALSRPVGVVKDRMHTPHHHCRWTRGTSRAAHTSKPREHCGRWRGAETGSSVLRGSGRSHLATPLQPLSPCRRGQHRSTAEQSEHWGKRKLASSLLVIALGFDQRIRPVKSHHSEMYSGFFKQFSKLFTNVLWA